MGLHRQKGYFLLALTAGLAVIAFGFVAAYSGLLAKKEQRVLLDTQKAYLESARTALEATYDANAALIDGDATESGYRDANTLLELAGIKKRWDLQAGVSHRLSRDGLDYTTIVLWLPNDTDEANPATFNEETGAFTSCSKSGTPCAPRAYITVSGLDIQKKRQEKAIKQLNQLASLHQMYFKTRMLQDPDHDLSINYFRAPDGHCDNPYNLPCLDDYTVVGDTSLVALLGLPADLLVNPWGLPIEASNLKDASQSTPFSMSFRSSTPWGTSYTISALQPV